MPNKLRWFHYIGLFFIFIGAISVFFGDEKKPPPVKKQVITPEIKFVLFCQSTEFASDKSVITYYSNNTADYIPYSSSGLFDSAYALKEKVVVSDYKYSLYSPYYKTVSVDRSNLLLSTMVVMSYHNSRGDTFESWRHYPCTESDSTLSQIALEDVKEFELKRANQKNQELANRKI